MRNRTVFFLIILLTAAVASMIFYFSSDKKMQEKKTVVASKSSDLIKTEIDSISVFSRFAKDFNSHKVKKLDQYIDPELGFMMYYHDGPYPIISFKNSIENEIDWLDGEIFENVVRACLNKKNSIIFCKNS